MENNLVYKPLISIVVPVFNVERHIKRCICSILNQTYENYELILVDDGSSDLSLDICRSYISKKIVVISQSNAGVSSARNHGINIAKGDFLAFIDSDDWVDKDYISSFFDNDCICSDLLYIQGIKREYNSYMKLSDVFPDEILTEGTYSSSIPKYKLFHCGYPVAKLFNLAIIKKYNLHFEEGLQTHEDHLFVFKYYRYVKGVYLKNSCAYHYMINQDVDTLSKKRHDPQMLFRASDLFFDEYKILLAKFILSDVRYVNLLYTDYGLTQRIKALTNMYAFQYSKSQRLALLNREFRVRKKLYKKHYHSIKRSRNIFVLVLLQIPLPIVDIVFNFYNKIH